ncbi:unnamed protein product [Arabis nemorensis]|uniref:MOM1 alpha-helical domain-containing protein n=1 Tax=Arabis nemorensis TaxID=586526 RepID=A0A565AM01_9BRAS|nr:unnamed protein product [Arabis nemorensis]
MKKNEKNGSAGRNIRTRSTSTSANASTVLETSGLRRSNRETPFKKPITPASGTRKSERLAPSPASATIKSGTMEKKNTASPLQRSGKGKNVSSENSKGSDKSVRNADTSGDIEKSMDKMKDNIEASTSKVKELEPKMTGRSYRALFRGQLKKKVTAPSNDEELVVVGCSRRVPAGNDDAQDVIEDSPPHVNSDSKMQPVGETNIENGTDSPLKSIRDTEKMVLDASPIVQAGGDNVVGSPETQKLLVSKSSLETDIDLPMKRKRDNVGIGLDACDIGANADDCVMSSDGVIPSPSGCKNINQPETCSTCEKRQKVDGDFENLSVCSCIPQPVQESDHMAQDMKETGPATSRDCRENRQNMQQDKSYDPKLSSIYPEYWVPVQLSNVQLELYCRTLFSKSLSLSSLSKDLVGALEETLTSVRKTCDHPYVMDASLKQHLTKNLELHEFLDVEVKASGKLHLLDAMLTQIKMNGFKAVVFYQATQSPEGLLLGNILEDFVIHRFGQKSYEHGVCSAKKNAINNFNKESECFVLLLETRACTQSIKLLQAEAFILFGSSLNPSQDVKFLEKIKIESYSERTKIFRLYSTFTVEEKALILARQNKRQNKSLENLTRPLIHALLMWGASYLFDKLDHFHGSAPDSGVPFEQSIMEGVIHEFSSILSSKVGKENEGKLCLLLEARYAQGTYSTDSTLFGEKHVKLSDEDSPNRFWTKLLGGKNPLWKYCSDTPQRSRKRVQYFQDSEKIAEIADDRNIKKKKKASADVTDPPVDNNERKASRKDHMGALESPKVVQPSCSSASDSLGRHISEIPDDMLAGNDWRKKPHESQKSLHAVLKSNMAELGKVLHLSEDSTSMVEKFLEYVIENYRVCKEPATTLQAFQIALSWIAASLVKQKLNHKESLVRAKSELAFNCSREEADYIYSVLDCMKSLFLEHTQRETMRQEKNNTKSMCCSDSEECMPEKRGSHYSLARKDIKKTISDIKRKCKKQEQKLVQKHEEKKVGLVNNYAIEKRQVESRKQVQRAVIRISCSGTSTQSLVDELKLLDRDYEKEIDEISSEMDKCLKSLDEMREVAKKKLAEYEACWISRLENWAQVELIDCLPIKSGNNKHFSGICSSNPSKNGPDVQTCNDANSEAAYGDTSCMVSKGNQVPEAENTLGTMKGGSTQQVHEIVASKNDIMDVSSLSREQPPDNVATKSQSNENTAGRQQDFAALNVHSSDYQTCDKVTSVAPDEDVPSRVPEISQSPAFSLNRDEALVTIENNRASHMGFDVDNILDQQNEEACSFDKEIPDESVVETRGSTESDQDDQNICPLPSSPCGKQPDPAANIQAQNIEVAIEPQPAGSETVETGAFAASEQGDQVACPLSSSPAGNQIDPVANIEGQNIRTSAEPHIAVPDAVEIGDSGVSDQETMGAQDACSPPSSLVGTQTDLAANIEGQNITTVAQLHTAGSDAVETGGSPVPDQGGQDASPLGYHPDAAVNSEGVNDTTIAEPHTTGSDACEMEIEEPSPRVEQSTLANNLVQIAHERGVERSAGVTAPVASLLNNDMGQVAVQPVPQIPFPVFNDPFQYELEKLRRESENIKKTCGEKRSILKAELERKMAELQAEYQGKFHEVDGEENTRTMENDKNMNLVLMNKLLANAFLSKCTDKKTSRTSSAPGGKCPNARAS